MKLFNTISYIFKEKLPQNHIFIFIFVIMYINSFLLLLLLLLIISKKFLKYFDPI